MTKCVWWKLFFVALLVSILVGFCFLEDKMVSESLNLVNDFCYQIEVAAVENGGIVNGEVASLVDNMEYQWKTHEETLCFLVNHKSIEPLGVEIVRLKTYIDEEEDIEFFVSLEIIKHYVETFQHTMGANFPNIL